jgi:hypothetical protein
MTKTSMFASIQKKGADFVGAFAVNLTRSEAKTMA